MYFNWISPTKQIFNRNVHVLSDWIIFNILGSVNLC